MQEQKATIKEKSEKMIFEILDSNFSKENKDVLELKIKATKLATSYVRDNEVNNRVSRGQQLRVFQMIASDKKQLRRYIEISMPKLLPARA